MRKASESRQKALDVTQERTNRIWNKLKAQIDKAVDKGELEMTFYDHIPDATIKLLKDLGYSCEKKQTGLNEYGFLIKW